MTAEEMETIIEKMEANKITPDELELIRREVDNLASNSDQTELQTIFMTGWVLCESRLIQEELVQRGRIMSDSPVWNHLTNIADDIDKDN